MAVSLKKSGDVKAHLKLHQRSPKHVIMIQKGNPTLVLRDFKTLHPMQICCHIARGWNKVPGSLLTCHKSLSWHFDNVGLTHPLLKYLSIYKKREGSDNPTQRWEAKENVKASWGQAIIVFGKTKLTKPNLLQREGIGIIRSSQITFILTPPNTNYYH